LLLLLLVQCTGPFAPAAFAQVPPEKGDAQKADQFLPLDYSRRGKLDRAEKLLAQHQFDDALPLLAQFLSDDSEDAFLASTGGISLKQRVGQLLSAMPAEGRRAWETLFGADARRLVSEATQAGTPDKLADALRRFPYTDASADAALLLARVEFDRSRPLAAAELYRQARSYAPARHDAAATLGLVLSLARAGRLEQAASALSEWRSRSKASTLVVAGKELALPSTRADFASWLERNFAQTPLVAPKSEDWALHRGDAARNELGDGSAPLLRRRWAVASFDDPAEEARVALASRAHLARGAAILPTATPLAISYTDAAGRAACVVLARTPHELLAVDFDTGRVLWQAPSSPQIEGASADDDDEADDDTNIRLRRAAMFRTGPMPLIVQRLWDDAPYGQLSADRRAVYALEDLGPSGTGRVVGSRFSAPISSSMHNDEARLSNQLVARSLAESGKPLWSVGGADSPAEPRLAGAFFLGAPLADGDMLYIIAEIKNEIRLVALDSLTGRMAWQQQLVPAARNITLDFTRRNLGAAVSFADGLLICPTAAGAVVAVDPKRRAIVWGYFYAKPPDEQITPFAFSSNRDRDDSDLDTWADTSVTIAGDNVLVTPADDDDGRTVYCLDLSTGALRWRRNLARRENLFVAGVLDRRVLVVGADRVQALNLTDGTPQWVSADFGMATTGQRSIPSGRGYASASSYFLPVTGRELIEISLADGKFLHRASTAARPLGNLIAFRGELVSFGVFGLEALYETDALRRQVDQVLAKTPNDAWALARRGELLLYANQVAAGQDALRHSLASAANERERAHAARLLAATLLDALARDFAGNRASIPEIETLTSASILRDRADRIIAAGLLTTGERREAFARYCKMIDSGSPDELLDIDEGHQVRRDAWISGSLATLLAASTAEERHTFDATVSQRIDAALATNTLGTIRAAVRIFAAHPAADLARIRLAQLQLARGDRLAAEQTLLTASTSSVPTTAAAALADVAQLYIAADRRPQAAACADELSARFADVRCTEQRTGRQFAVEIREQILLHRALVDSAGSLAAPKAWPTGQIHADIGRRQGSNSPRETRFQIPLTGPRQETFAAFADGELLLDRSAHEFIRRDPSGNESVLVELDAKSATTLEREIDPYACSVRSRGHAVAVSIGRSVFIANGFAAIGERSPAEQSPAEPIWQQAVVLDTHASPGFVFDSPYAYPSRRTPGRRDQINTAWGEARFRALDDDARVAGAIGPVGEFGFCYQKGRDLVCSDPLTGDLVWSVANVPEGCELFGDDELTFAAPPSAIEALVFRTADGQALGVRPIPSETRRMATLGRRVLEWGQADGKLQIRFVDLWSGEKIWSRTVELGSVAHVRSDDIAVLEPSGRFALLSIATGAARFEQPLLNEFDEAGISRLVSLHTIESADHFIVVANRNKTPDRTSDGKTTWVNRQMPLVSGRVYSLNPSTGQPQWPIPAEVDSQGLALAQPADSPLLFFLRHIPTGESRGRPAYHTQVLTLDKRTGCVVMSTLKNTKHWYSQMDLDAAHAFSARWLVDRTAARVTLALPAQSVVFQFTDQPRSPEPPLQLADRDPDQEAGQIAKSIASAFKSIGREQAAGQSSRNFYLRDDSDEDE
jgi:outer membrane protein assembly factor BamB